MAATPLATNGRLMISSDNIAWNPVPDYRAAFSESRLWRIALWGKKILSSNRDISEIRKSKVVISYGCDYEKTDLFSACDYTAHR